MKFNELKYKYLDNYMELEDFKKHALILNVFVIDLEHQIHVMCSETKKKFDRYIMLGLTIGSTTFHATTCYSGYPTWVPLPRPPPSPKSPAIL